MRRTFWKFGAALGIAAGALLAAPATSGAAVISLNDLLQNASFEGGVTGTCPNFWSCTNLNVGVVQPTAAQYPHDNGLPQSGTGQIVPDGLSAAFSPITGSATGHLSQSIAGESWLANSTYTLEFWLGNPLTTGPNPPGAGAVYPSRIDVQLLAGAFGSTASNILCDVSGDATLVSGSQSAQRNNGSCLFAIQTNPWLPVDGDWRKYTLTFTTGASIQAGVTGNIGVIFSVFPQQAAENGALMHLDMVGKAPVVDDRCVGDNCDVVPEPATLMLLGMGLVGVGATVRRRRQLGH